MLQIQQFCKLNPFSPWPTRKRCGLFSNCLLSSPLPQLPPSPKTTNAAKCSKRHAQARPNPGFPESKHSTCHSAMGHTGPAVCLLVRDWQATCG